MLKKVFKILIFIILLFSMISYTYGTQYVWSENIEDNVIQTNAELLNENTNFLSLSSSSAILIDVNTGNILYDYNSHEQLRPASVTKTMVLLLIMEAIEDGRISYEDKVSCSENARQMGGSQIWLDETETLTVDEMLKAICVVSANDCTVAMAEFISGSEEAFVNLMNERAKELGMNNTVFKNPHGIDEDGHLTTAYDIAIMSRELIKNFPEIKKYTTIWMDELRNGKSQLVNTNKLIRTYEGATGLKTGSTSLAKYNLSFSAERDGLELIGVIMKSETSAIRFAEAKQMLDYGFNTYSFVKFADAYQFIEEVNVAKGVLKTVNAIYEEDSGSLLKKGEETDVIQEVNLERNLVAPIFQGQKIGEVVYTLNNEIVGKTNIVAGKGVSKQNLVNSITYIFWEWFDLCRD